MGLFSASLRFCLLYFLFTAEKGLGKTAELSSSSSSSSETEKTMDTRECPVVPEEVLLRLMGMINVTLSNLQCQKPEEGSSDIHDGDTLRQLPSAMQG